MKVSPLPRWRDAGPLALALLAALLLHGLWLAELQLRQRRQPPPQRLQRPDDTPELLVFSRQPPEPLGLEAVPLPPPSALPPPPPLLPEQRSPGKPKPVGSRPSPSGRPGSASRPSVHQAARPASRSLPRTGLRQQGPPPLPPLPPAGPLEALREARARGPEASPPMTGEAQQRWRALWQRAEPGPSPPAALAARPNDAELRRLPLAQARAEGLEPDSGRPLHFDDHWLLPWIDGEQLWLLRLAS